MTDERAAVELKVKTWIPCIDTFMDGGVEHVNAYMREHEAGEHVLLRDFVALRAENERLLREQAEFTGAALCALGLNRDECVSPGNQVLDEIERLTARVSDLTRLLAEAGENLKMSSAQVRAAERTIRALQSGEGGKG